MNSAFRSLGNRPGYAAAAVLTLALGIGANIALFSAIKSVLLDPLPYRDPDGVAMVWSQWTGFPKTWVSIPEYHQYRTRLQSFEDLALFQPFEVNITEGDAERVRAATVTPNMLRVLGVAPVLGRDFDADDATEGRSDVVLISHGLWQARYAGDPSVVGRDVSINGAARTVIGVLPQGFRLPLDYAHGEQSQVYLPLVLPADTGVVPHGGGNHSYFMIGRLQPGVTVAAANAELDAHVRQLAADGVYASDMRFSAFAVTAPDEVAGELRPALIVLLGAVVLVLLIACANVAGLALVRGEERRHELGVRAALGAGRGRLVRQLLAESALLGAVGALAGIGLAWLCVRVFSTSTAFHGLPRLADSVIDLPVLGFASAAAVVATLLAGLVPALHGARVDPRTAMQDGGRGGASGGSRGIGRHGIVAAQVALAVVLVTGAGLALRSFWNLVDIDPGFDPGGVLTMRLAPNSAYFPDDPAVSGFYGEFLRRVRGRAGVEYAGLILRLPIDTDMGDTGLQVEGYESPSGRSAPAEWQAASPGYFEAMRIPVVQGRVFYDGDDANSPLVVIVNEAFVREYVPDGNPLGKRIRLTFRDDLPWWTIVGVVGDVRHNGLTGDVKPGFYRPHAQWAVPLGNPLRSMTLVVRAERDLHALAGEIRAQLRTLDTRVPLSRVQSMHEVMSVATAQPRLTLHLLGGFAVLALALAALGIYSVVSYLVAARRREIGVRIALGATRGDVVRHSLRRGLAGAGSGALAGIAAAAIGVRALAGLLYEVDIADPPTYAATVLLLAAVALAASWLPARRAARIDPMQALREE